MNYGNQNEKLAYNMQEEGVKRNTVERVEEKDLGVIFDPLMAFSKHIVMVANKANPRSYQKNFWLHGYQDGTLFYTPQRQFLDSDFTKKSNEVCVKVQRPFLTRAAEIPATPNTGLQKDKRYLGV